MAPTDEAAHIPPGRQRGIIIVGMCDTARNIAEELIGRAVGKRFDLADLDLCTDPVPVYEIRNYSIPDMDYTPTLKELNPLPQKQKHRKKNPFHN
jgi:hypothetical protein